MKPFVVAIVSVFSMSSLASANSQSFPADKVRSLNISNGSGDINITGDATKEAKVTWVNRSKEKDCKMDIDLSGNTLNVKPSSSNSNRCSFDITLNTAKTLDVTVKNGSGDVMIGDTEGDLEIRLGSGNASIKSVIKGFDVKTGSGEITAMGLTQGGRVSTGSGDISLSYRTAPKSGQLSTKSGSGDADISLPGASKIKTSFRAGSGDLRSAFANDPDAPFEISMKAGSGDLTITKSK
ncbi:MAG: DUF4097 family beta strand repeat protein [Pseudobacteriovorax sp.]|nr:DUF4097 family beta strand repeat protein [Pseudobacteriovorax sp.]